MRLALFALALAGTAFAQISLDSARSRCIDFAEVKRADVRDCRVSEFGRFGSVDGETYYYALYCLIPKWPSETATCGDDSFEARFHAKRGLAVYTARGAGTTVTPLLTRADGENALYYEPPEIPQSSAGTLLYLPIVVDGTGHGNESEYFLRASGKWLPIDAREWLTDLRRRIPAGLEIWKGVWPNLKTMQAVAGLYRPTDANCCPTGGSARIGLKIQSRRFVIDSFRIEPGQ